jgi:hypothetical protein
MPRNRTPIKSSQDKREQNTLVDVVGSIWQAIPLGLGERLVARHVHGAAKHGPVSLAPPRQYGQFTWWRSIWGEIKRPVSRFS